MNDDSKNKKRMLSRSTAGNLVQQYFDMVGVMLIAQHWTSVVLGLASMGLAYLDTFKADQNCIEKFGDAYRRYRERVPRVNFIAGIARWIRRRQKAQS